MICSDKTGTLTRNEMTVTTLALPGRDDVRVTGVGYEPVGEFYEGDNEINPSMTRCWQGCSGLPR